MRGFSVIFTFRKSFTPSILSGNICTSCFVAAIQVARLIHEPLNMSRLSLFQDLLSTISERGLGMLGPVGGGIPTIES